MSRPRTENLQSRTIALALFTIGLCMIALGHPFLALLMLGLGALMIFIPGAKTPRDRR